LLPYAMDTSTIEILATAVGTVILTMLTIALWMLARRQQRNQEIDQAVSARISGHLQHFLDLSERSRVLVERTEEIQTEANQIQNSIQEDRDQLSDDRKELTELKAQLEDLRNHWGQLVPTMESIEESPELLRVTAEEKLAASRTATEPEQQQAAMREANAYLRRLADHPDAESKDLELGGDLAREQLRMPTLARRLYEKSLAVDSSNVSAQAELAALRIRQPAERSEALEELMGLMTEHPEAKNARFSLFNHFMDVNRYDELAKICRKLVDNDPRDVTAWRNLGVALAHLEGESGEARKAYETSLEFARKEGERGDLGNTARPFARLLRNEGSEESLALATDILKEALREDPLDASVHSSMGDTLWAAGKPGEAVHYYVAAEGLGSPPEVAYAGKRRQEMQILQAIGLLDESDLSMINTNGDT
jgi:tetratricopeptide (TPR) repeat protein